MPTTASLMEKSKEKRQDIINMPNWRDAIIGINVDFA